MHIVVQLPPRRSWLAAAISVFSLVAAPAVAQISTDRVEGLRDNTPRSHVLTGARLVIAPGQVIDNGTLVIRDGIIVAAGAAAAVAVPAGAREWQLKGRTVYAGFIDLASNVGVPASLRPPPAPPISLDGAPPAATPPPARMAPSRSLVSRNMRVHPKQEVALQLELKADDIKQARELGFTTVLSTPATGVFRGQSALVNMGGREQCESAGA